MFRTAEVTVFRTGNIHGVPPGAGRAKLKRNHEHVKFVGGGRVSYRSRNVPPWRSRNVLFRILFSWERPIVRSGSGDTRSSMRWMSAGSSESAAQRKGHLSWQKRSRMQAGTNTGCAKASSTATAPASCIATMASQWARIDDSERRTYSSGSWSRSHSARANCILAGMYVDPRTSGHLPVHDEAPPLQLAEVLPSRPVADEHARSRKSRRSVAVRRNTGEATAGSMPAQPRTTRSGPTGVRNHPLARSRPRGLAAARRPDPPPAPSYPPRFGFVLRMISLKPQQVARF